MMYFYWTRKGIRPSFFYELPKGELALIRAFYEEYVEELSKNESMCPMMMFQGMINRARQHEKIWSRISISKQKSK